MQRREFFRRGLGKVGEVSVRAADARVTRRASRWVRPPYALAELEFLLACTRCGACTEACPHHVVFALSVSLGADVAGTPALDLLRRGCHLCDDWPCVAACEPGALTRERAGPEGVGLPVLARVSIDTGSCLPYLGPECGACKGSCPVPGALAWEMEHPVIVDGLCTGCALCREACILEPKAIGVKSVYAETDP